MRKCFIVRSVLNIKFTLCLLLFSRLASCDSGLWRYHLKSYDTSIGYRCRSGRHNLRSFLAANSTQNYFLIARTVKFFATFATKVPRDFAVLPGRPVKKGWGLCSFKVPSQIHFFNLLFWDNSTLNLGLSIAHNQALPLQNIVRVDSIRNFNDAF